MFSRFYRTRQANPTQVITPTDLYAQLQSDKPPVVIDVRSPQEFAHDGHISGAQLIPLPSLLQNVNSLTTEQPIVFACHSGARSEVACKTLAMRGFDNIINLTGGMSRWRRVGLPMDYQEPWSLPGVKNKVVPAGHDIFR